MHMRLLIGHPSRKGPFFIGQSADGRFHPIWQGESLGSYHSAAAAVEDLAGGHTFWIPDGTDPGRLGLSSEPDDWVPAQELM